MAKWTEHFPFDRPKPSPFFAKRGGPSPKREGPPLSLRPGGDGDLELDLFLDVALQLVDGDPLLGHGVPVADSDAAVLLALKVVGDAEGGATG